MASGLEDFLENTRENRNWLMPIVLILVSIVLIFLNVIIWFSVITKVGIGDIFKFLPGEFYGYLILALVIGIVINAVSFLLVVRILTAGGDFFGALTTVALPMIVSTVSLLLFLIIGLIPAVGSLFAMIILLLGLMASLSLGIKCAMVLMDMDLLQALTTYLFIPTIITIFVVVFVMNMMVTGNVMNMMELFGGRYSRGYF
ncbi:hypothetical protein ACFL1H_06920 [Nanoarchaeota archaeon]